MVAGFLYLLWSSLGAWTAKKQGYSFWLFLLVGLAASPLLSTLLLLWLPDRRHEALRETWSKELRASLLLENQAASGKSKATGPAPQHSLGDASTVA